MSEAWAISGAEGEAILGDCHLPVTGTKARGVVLIAHGFKGYKDYGMFPRLAEELSRAGFVAHRFNFSHSGMTNQIETFERPDLFERDTWNKQVLDLRAVVEAMARGEIAGTSLPYVMFGHSRGGVTALLTGGRFADDPRFPQPVGVITAAAPAACNPLSREEADRLMEDGYLESPSSRTGQRLRVGKAFLQEQLDDPEAHDLLRFVRRIRCQILVIHGDRDPTVDASHAKSIANATGGRADVRVIRDADHVFNTPNPMPANAAASQQLQTLIAVAVDVCQRVTSI